MISFADALETGGGQSQQRRLHHDNIYYKVNYIERDRVVVQCKRSVICVQNFKSIQSLVQFHRGDEHAEAFVS